MKESKKIKDNEHNNEELIDEKLDRLIDQTQSENEALKKILKGLENMKIDNDQEIKKQKSKLKKKTDNK